MMGFLAGIKKARWLALAGFWVNYWNFDKLWVNSRAIVNGHKS
jgi:hypothetical protein